mgnify:CR=1 FL=1
MHMKLKKMFRALDAAGAVVDREKRTARFPFSSEFPVERYFGKEILSHAPGCADLGRFKNRANLLWNHNIDDVRGVIEDAEIDGTERRGYVEVRFSKSAEGEKLMNEVDDKIITNVSFMYRIIEMVLQKAGEGVDAVNEYLATKWEPLEVSFVSIPADPTVGIGRAEADEESEVSVLNDKPVKKAKELKTMDPIELKKLQDEARAAGIKEANERTDTILAIGEKHGMQVLARELIAAGKTVAEAQTAFLERMGKEQKPVSETAAVIGLTDKEIRKFSFLRAMQAMANPTDRKAQEAAKFEREASDAAAIKAGKAPQGFLIPVDVLRAATIMQNQRDLTVGSATAGGNLVATNLVASSFIDLLRNKMVLARLGAQTLNGLVGNIAIPKLTGAATAYWVGENAAPTEGAQTVGQVSMSPKTLAAYTDMSRKLIMQSSIDVENMVKGDLAQIIALAADSAGLYGSGSSNQPTGLRLVSGLNTVDFAAADPTYAEIVAMESAVAADNADVGTMAYAVNALGRGALKTTEKASSTGQFIWEQGNTVNGYRCEVSNQISKLSTADQDFWFGNWNDLILGFWSGLDLLVDPYTGSKEGTVRVVGFQDMDVAARHGESFCYGNKTIS